MLTIKKLTVAFLLLTSSLLPLSASRDIRPVWVRQGEEHLNRARKSDGYEFKIFYSFDADLTRLRAERFRSLVDYAATLGGTESAYLQLDSLTAAGSPTIYVVRGGSVPVYARLVDEYCTFEDYVDNEYGFERWQLFAVSAGGTAPVFDTFTVMEPDNTRATFLSIVPGAGQFYKGAPGKACAIIGSELALGAGAIVFQKRKEYAAKKVSDGEFPIDSWESKTEGYKLMRNVCFGAMAGIWIYGLIDAAVTDGASRVRVSAPRGGELSFGPADYGMGLTYKF